MQYQLVMPHKSAVKIPFKRVRRQPNVRQFIFVFVLLFSIFLYVPVIHGRAISSSEGSLSVDGLRCNNKVTPNDIDTQIPQFSWILRSRAGARSQFQLYYQIQVASDPKLLSKGEPDLWDSGKIAAQVSNNISYRGKVLESNSKYYWRVRVWDQANRLSTWSQPSYWQTALLNAGDWKGEWIADSKSSPAIDSLLYQCHPAPLFRKTFPIRKNVKCAMLFISSLGYYEAYINGHRVGNRMLDPGQTEYARRVFYSTYDVTPLLNNGENAIGVMLGNGWYNPLPLRMWGWLNIREHLTIGQPSFILQLNIEYEDGSKAVVCTDKNWLVHDGPILRNDVYLGEHYDSRKSLSGWSTAAFKPKRWRRVNISDYPKSNLTAQIQPPVIVKDTLTPVKLTMLENGKQIVDFGENFGGIVKLRVQAEAGTVIRIRYGELLYPDGSLNIMTSTAGQIKRAGVGGPGAPDTAYQEDVFITSGAGIEEFQPRFTYHGFRYAEVNGYPRLLTPKDIHGLKLSADVPEVGSFICSDSLINRIQEACLNTFTSNLFSVQSDCPHREKFGYGGDIYATCEAFINNFDMNSFYTKTVMDFADAARTDGGLTETAPFVGIADYGLGKDSGPIEWGAAHPFLIRKLFQYYGNVQLLEEQYPVAKKWVGFLSSKAKDNMIDITIGDHESIAPKDLAVSGTSFYYANTALVAWMAKKLGYEQDERLFSDLAEQIKCTFNAKLVNQETGKVGLGTQATQAYALYFNLLSDSVAQKALQVLEDQVVHEHQGHISTGMFGTKFLPEVLSNHGKAGLAYDVVTKAGFPGWVHMLDSGATTIWEHWAFSDNTFSHNHPMFGTISEWFFRYLAGIRPSEEAIGYNHIIIQPKLIGLSSAKAEYQSMVGKIKSDWHISDGSFYLDVSIPVNANAKIHVPTDDPLKIKEGGKPLAETDGIHQIEKTADSIQLDVGSGEYRFKVEMP